MTNILYPPARPQSVGEILDSAFRIFGATLVKCLPYAILAVIAGQLPTLYDVARGRPLMQAVLMQRIHDPLWWVMYIVAVLGTMTLTNAVVLRQYALATGHPAATGAELGTSLRRIPGIFLIGLLLALTIMACFLPAGIFLGAAFGGTHKAAFAVVAVLMLIPLSWFLVRWSCAITVYLLTERGPVASMSHSWRLTSGNFWRLSLIYSVGVVLLLVLYALSSVIGFVLALMFGHGDVAVITAATAVAAALIGGVATPFYWALGLAVLGDLSVRKEGADLAQRISAPASH
jgi:hypothetical protein